MGASTAVFGVVAILGGLLLLAMGTWLATPGFYIFGGILVATGAGLLVSLINRASPVVTVAVTAALAFVLVSLFWFNIAGADGWL